MTRYTHPEGKKTVTVTNKAVVTVLEANGWVADTEKPVGEDKPRRGRPPKKTEE